MVHRSDEAPQIAEPSASTSAPSASLDPYTLRPAGWTRPLARLEAAWTRLETWMVLLLLIAAILYMTFWVTLNSFHTKGGKLAPFPGGLALFAGSATLLTWARDKNRKPVGAVLPAVLLALGGVLVWAKDKQAYFSNIAHWLAEASIIKQIGTPEIVSARLFTIWIALLGGSLAAGAGRQINIDVLMRFMNPKPRLAMALFGYAVSAAACFTISWGFLDYIAITGYSADKTLPPMEKVKIVASSVSRHLFVARKQVALDAHAFLHVVLKGQPYDKWYTAAEWNAEVNDGGWVNVYPPPTKTMPAAGAPPYPTKPCLSSSELTALAASNGSVNPDWRLPGACDQGEPTATRAPLATAPDPDDRSPLGADLSLLFPWGFFILGCRLIMRSALAIGGAVSTDPNAAHGGDDPSIDHVTHQSDEQKVAAEGDQEMTAAKGDQRMTAVKGAQRMTAVKVDRKVIAAEETAAATGATPGAATARSKARNEEET